MSYPHPAPASRIKAKTPGELTARAVMLPGDVDRDAGTGAADRRVTTPGTSMT